MGQRTSQPFRFRGEIPAEPSYEDLAILEAAARRKQYRPMTTKQQIQRAKAEQATAGIRVRIDRPVANFEDFKSQLSAWYVLEAAGSAKRRKLGVSKPEKRLEVTLLDSRSQTLGYIDESLTEEDLTRRLHDTNPGLFKATGQIAFNGLALFGQRNVRPWVAMPISPVAHSLRAEVNALRGIVAPGSQLSSDHLSDDKLHVSLGDITVHDSAKVQAVFEELRQGILPLLPSFIEFGPARVSVQTVDPR